MMEWQVKFTREGIDDLRSLDKTVGKRIVNKILWLKDNFEIITPEPLSDKWRGYFKLRVGDWRIVYEIEFSKKTIIIHRIERRDRVYKI